MKLPFYLKEAAVLWLIFGTIISILSASRGFELSFNYLLGVLVSWGLIVGLPFSILQEVGNFLERKSNNIPSANEKDE